MKKIFVLLTTFTLLFSLCGCQKDNKIKIDLLLLPKFEIGEMTKDMAGEAQLLYEAYLKDGKTYEIQGVKNPLYVKDNVALLVTDEGKVNAAKNVALTLADNRFDFSSAFFMSVGCTGSPTEDSVMGDVYVITSTFDYDLGHRVDARELSNPDTDITWFGDDTYKDIGHFNLNKELTDKVYELVKDVKVVTTEKTRNIMSKTFDNASWAIRDPKVQKGSTCTSDNYWKGMYGEKNAKYIADYYDLSDPYLSTEMEDNAIAHVLNDFNYLDKYISIRVSVNMDVFLNGATAESTWVEGYQIDSSIVEDENETADIFEYAMTNLFNVSSIIVDAILNKEI